MNSTKPLLTIQHTDLTNVLRALVRRPRVSSDDIGEGATATAPASAATFDQFAEDEAARNALHDALAAMFRSLDESQLDESDRERMRAFLAMNDERRRASAGEIEVRPTLVLRPRHRETLRWLLTGATEKEIAAGLGLSVHTVHQYVKAIYRRFRVTSRAQLMAAQLRQRVMEIPA